MTGWDRVTPPVAWLDDTRPPLGIDLDTWAALSWWDRHTITRRTTPPPPSPADPPWRLQALALRDQLDALAAANGRHVRHHPKRRHRAA